MFRDDPEYVVEDRGYKTPCWVWQWARDRLGYGHLKRSLHGRNVWFAHRWYYETTHGRIPDGLHIDHLCRVPACVNPAHMEVVTAGENVLRGVSPSAQNARKTHCKRGHPFDDDNTMIVIGPRGRPVRYCRTCCKRRSRQAAARRRETAA